jgi:hypothetical protein
MSSIFLKRQDIVLKRKHSIEAMLRMRVIKADLAIRFESSSSFNKEKKWSWREESNPRPADYKSAALPTELRQRNPLEPRIVSKWPITGKP